MWNVLVDSHLRPASNLSGTCTAVHKQCSSPASVAAGQLLRSRRSLQTSSNSLRCFSLHHRVPRKGVHTFLVCSMASALTLCSSGQLVAFKLTTARRNFVHETSLCRDAAARIRQIDRRLIWVANSKVLCLRPPFKYQAVFEGATCECMVPP